MEMKKTKSNPIVHFEIPADNVARAKKFYEKTFGWGITKFEMDSGEYFGVRTTEVGKNMMPIEPGAINGGMLRRGSVITGPTFAIDVENIDEAIEKIKHSGGIIVREKKAVGPM